MYLYCNERHCVLWLMSLLKLMMNPLHGDGDDGDGDGDDGDGDGDGDGINLK